MDEQRKMAYRYLLYWAMLDLRPLQWLGGRGWRAWSPIHSRAPARRVRRAGAIADWLHNLARYSAHDFRGFNEEWFWRDYESARSRYPDFGLERYRDQFERFASPAPERGPDPEPGAAPDRGRTQLSWSSPMAFNFSQCRSRILEGVLAGLRLRADRIAEIAAEVRVPGVEYPIDGVSLDLVPWHAALGVSFRRHAERDPDVRYCNVEWTYFDVVSHQTCAELKAVADFVHEAYTSEDANALAVEMAHLIFLAGAEAILDPRVAQTLVELGINAPTYRDRLLSPWFEYLVLDFDGNVRANYCELVLANRVTAKWWPRLT